MNSRSLMSDPNSLSFEQGDAKWDKLRQRSLTDLYWFCANVLGYAKRVPMREPTHLLLCKFVEKRTGHAALDSASRNGPSTLEGVTAINGTPAVRDKIVEVIQSPARAILSPHHTGRQAPPRRRRVG